MSSSIKCLKEFYSSTPDLYDNDCFWSFQNFMRHTWITTLSVLYHLVSYLSFLHCHFQFDSINTHVQGMKREKQMCGFCISLLSRQSQFIRVLNVLLLPCIIHFCYLDAVSWSWRRCVVQRISYDITWKGGIYQVSSALKC